MCKQACCRSVCWLFKNISLVVDNVPEIFFLLIRKLSAFFTLFLLDCKLKFPLFAIQWHAVIGWMELNFVCKMSFYRERILCVDRDEVVALGFLYFIHLLLLRPVHFISFLSFPICCSCNEKELLLLNGFENLWIVLYKIMQYSYILFSRTK